MPDADGFELMDLIQTGLKLSTPVVMMSTDTGDVRLKSLRSGAAQFLPKPVRADALQALWQVTPVNSPTAAAAAAEEKPARSHSLRGLDEAGLAAGLGVGGVLLQMRSAEPGGSWPTAGLSVSRGAARVERLLKEREMRRVRSSTGLLSEAEADVPVEVDTTESSSPTQRQGGADAADDGPSLSDVEPRQRLLVVANRLPVSAKKRPDGAWSLEISAGGLVSALLGIQQNYDICWIGWPGAGTSALCPAPTHHTSGRHRSLTSGAARAHRCVNFSSSPLPHCPPSAALAKEGCIPVYLDSDTVERYYNGYCNNVLWPLFHYVPLPFEARLDETNNVSVQWAAYKYANELFADAILAQYCPGDVVWCHDYHLMMLPAVLRERDPRMKVGWFLHTPFPSSEIYRTLPLREELLRGVLKADLIGFHTYDYGRHFVSACTRILGLEGTPEGVEDNGVCTRVAAFPIGIDPERFTRALETDAVRAHMAELRLRFAGRKVMLGVDRLDMIKGIPQKLLGFEKFLEEHPEWRDRVLLVQIAVPTRSNVREYKRLANQVHEIVGRINGRFGSLASVPIHHLDRTLAFDELCALYAVTDVAMVTSLRDGMNLVSYEFVACQSSNAGVLILSEFAGAAQSLGAGAILVNPWNVRDIASAIEDALTMSESERRERQRQNFFHVTIHTAQAWADTFVSELNDTYVEAELRTKRIPPALHIGAAVSVFARAKGERLLILGFNSTLTAAVDAPRRQRQQFDQSKSLVTLHPAAEAALQALAADPRTTLCIVSGSERGRLEEYFGGLRAWLVAENGVFVRTPEHAGGAPDSGWVTTAENAHLEWLESVQHVFDYFCERTPRSFVERRDTSLVWNYKYSDPEFGRLQARDLLQHLWTGPISNAAVDVIQGSKSVEVRPTGISKGVAIELILRDLSERHGLAPHLHAKVDFALCVGHFLGRDEDIFTRLVSYTEEAAPRLGGLGARLPSNTSNFAAAAAVAVAAAAAEPETPPSADGASSGGWWTQKRERRARERRSMGGVSGPVHPSCDESAEGAEADEASGLEQEGKCVFTCTVGRKRSQARYFLNDSDEVVQLLEGFAATLREEGIAAAATQLPPLAAGDAAAAQPAAAPQRTL